MNKDTNTTLVNDLFFEDQNVRIFGTPEKPTFAVNDTCEILDIANARDAIAKLDEDEKGVVTADTLGGKQTINVVTESGLYALIFQSRKPIAKKFRKWVTSEVLPHLRRRSFYSMTGGQSASSEVAILSTRLEIAKIREEAQYLEDQLEWQLSLPGGLTVAEYAQEHGLSSQQVAVLGYRMACAAKKHHWQVGTRPSTRGRTVAAYLPEHFAALAPLKLS